MTPSRNSPPSPVFAGPLVADHAVPDRVAVGRARIEARERRTRMIRRRVAAWSAGLFAAAWLGIAVQLVSGHDPALSKSASASSVSSAVNSAASTGSSTGTAQSSSSGGSGSGSSASGTSGSSSGSGSSSLTTRQS